MSSTNTPANGTVQPIDGKRGATILGPSNRPLQAQQPDMVASPATDNGDIPNMWMSYSNAHNHLTPGGWGRQITIRDLPTAKTLAGVDMRLTAGGIRELHWHSEAEWGFMIAGKARVGVVDQDGRTFQDDVSAGDLWNFPAGIPHSIQGLEPEGCEFLLVFDDGNFSEESTFLLSDWFLHTPREVLAKNFGVAESAFDGLPAKPWWIFQGEVPPPLDQDRVKGAGPTPVSYTFRMMEQEPITTASGTVRIVDSKVFPAASTIAAALVEVEPGGMREMHWHPNADEWQYYISEQGRMTVFASSGDARTFDYRAGDIGSIPQPMGHYIENIGTETLRFLELFRSDHYEDVSLAKWLAFTPFELVHAHLGIDRSVLEKVQARKTPVVPA